jgi:FkbM family methyltransferase
MNDRRQLRIWEQFIASGNEYIDCNIGFGGILRLNRQSSLSRWIATGDFERGERKLVSKVLRKGDFFVDIGANIGLYTVLAAKLVGAKGKVLAIEPSPTTSIILGKQLEINRLSNVTIIQAGVSSEAGFLDLWDCTAGGDAFSSFGKPIHEHDYVQRSVPVDSLDKLLEKYSPGIKPKLMKIDVEGWESNVLQGSQKILSSSDAPDLLIEFCEKALRGSGSSCIQLYDSLRSLGYKLSIVDHYSGHLRPWSVPQALEYENVLASKKN